MENTIRLMSFEMDLEYRSCKNRFNRTLSVLYINQFKFTLANINTRHIIRDLLCSGAVFRNNI